MPFVEINSQPPIQYSNLTGFVGFRVFRVWGGVSRNLVIDSPQNVTDPTSGQLPSYDSLWPGQDPQVGATLEQWTVGVESGDVLLATAIYTDRRGRGEFTSSFQTEREEIEYAYRTWIVRPTLTPTGTLPAPGTFNARAWYTDAIARYSTWYKIAKTVYVQLPAAHAANPVVHLDIPIATQVNKIHDIGNSSGVTPGSPAVPLFARFEGGDIQRLTWDRFRIVYEWTVESGVRWPGNSFEDILQAAFIGGSQGTLDANDYSFPRFVSRLYGGSGVEVRPYLRPPFEQVRTVPKININDPLDLQPPQFWAFMEFEPEPNGFTVLPGV